MTKQQTTAIRRHRRTAALLTLVALTVVACGDDSTGDSNASDAATAPIDTSTAPPESTDTPPPTAPGEATPTTVVNEASSTAACDPYYQINAAMGGAADPSTVPALLDELELVVPGEIEEPLTFMIETARGVFAGDMEDMSPLESPEFFDAVVASETWMFDNCEFDTRVEVDAIDFAYEGIDAEYAPGRAAFLITNAGTDGHELMLIRRNDDTADSWDELLSLPEDEAMEKATPIGSAWVGLPGSQETLVVDLVPGDYIAVCFIPQGTMVFEDGYTEGTGPPHFMLGMRTEFTVT